MQKNIGKIKRIFSQCLLVFIIIFFASTVVHETVHLIQIELDPAVAFSYIEIDARGFHIYPKWITEDATLRDVYRSSIENIEIIAYTIQAIFIILSVIYFYKKI